MGVFLPEQMKLIPWALVLRDLGLSNTIAGLVLIHVVQGISFTTLFCRNYYVGIPPDLMKAARVDGAGFFRTFWRIVLPLSPPILIVTVIWQFTGIWNEFLYGVTFTTGAQQPVTAALIAIATTAPTDVPQYGIQSAAVLLAALPTLLVYFFGGQYFMRGLTAGATQIGDRMAALRIRGLHKRFGAVKVLKGIDLTIDNGEFTVLLGPSGCGKSTLLNIIAGPGKPERRHDRDRRARRRRRVAEGPRHRDGVPVLRALSGDDGARQHHLRHGMPRRAAARSSEEAVARVAALLQIGELLDRKPAQLSGGQRQRVAMGRALVRDPLLFLFDEPLSNLDAKLRVDMRTEIKQLHQRIAATIVYVTHDQIEAMTMASRIAVMNHGEIQQFAAPDTVYNRPANLFVARFLGTPPMNTVPARLARRHDGLEAVIGAGRRRDPPAAAAAARQLRAPSSIATSCSASARNASARPDAVFAGTPADGRSRRGSRSSSRPAPRPWC